MCMNCEYNYKGIKQRHKEWQRIVDDLRDSDLSKGYQSFITVRDNRESYYKRKEDYDKRQQEITDTFMDHILEHLT